MSRNWIKIKIFAFTSPIFVNPKFNYLTKYRSNELYVRSCYEFFTLLHDGYIFWWV